MITPDASHASTRQLFRRTWLTWVGWMLILFTVGVVNLLRTTGGMTNEFARLAREEFQGTIALMNLHLLVGYLLIAAATSAIVVVPVLRLERRRPGSWRLTAWRATWLGLLMHLLLFGVFAPMSPIILDWLSYRLHAVYPSIDAWGTMKQVPVVLRWISGILVLLWLAEVLRLSAGKLRSGTPRLRRLATAGAVFVLTYFGMVSLLGSPTAATPPAPELPNVLIIGTDSLRADHLGCYGYERPTSPTIDRFAAEGVVHEQMFVPTGSTMESWMSLLSGRWPHTHGIRYMYPNKERVAAAQNNPDLLPRLLGKHGYRSTIVSNWAGNCFALMDMGFERRRTSNLQNFYVFIAETLYKEHFLIPYYFNNEVGHELFPAIEEFTTFLSTQELDGELYSFIEESRAEGKPFFGAIFYSTTHLPFTAKGPYNTMFTDPDYDGPNKYEIEFGVDKFMQEGFRNAVKTPEERQHVINLYDGCVRQFDDQVRDILAYLERTGLDKSTIVVLMSDHGDDLFDPGTSLGHGMSFFGGDHVNQIPYIVRYPDRRHAGKRLEPIVRSIDWAPTLLEDLGLDVPESYEGRSYRELQRTGAKTSERLAYGETCYLFFPKRLEDGEDAYYEEPADRTLRVDPAFDYMFVLKDKYHDYVIRTKDRCCWTPRWKLIYIPGKQGALYRLYDRIADPQNTNNLLKSGPPPAVFEPLKRALHDWMDRKTETRWTAEMDGK